MGRYVESFCLSMQWYHLIFIAKLGDLNRFIYKQILPELATSQWEKT